MDLHSERAKTHTQPVYTLTLASRSLFFLSFFGLANAFGPHINLFLIYLCMREYAGPACFTALRLFDLRIKLHKRPGKVRRGSLAKGEEWHGKQEEGQEAGGASCIAIVIHTGQIRLVYNGAHTTTASLLSFPFLSLSVSVWPLIHLLLHCRQKRRVVSSIWEEKRSPCCRGRQINLLMSLPLCQPPLSPSPSPCFSLFLSLSWPHTQRFVAI